MAIDMYIKPITGFNKKKKERLTRNSRSEQIVNYYVPLV